MISRREINALTAALNKLSVKPATRRRRRARQNVNPQIPAGFSSTPNPAPTRRRRGRGRNPQSNTLGVEGKVRLKRSEILASVSAKGNAAQAIALLPTSTVLTFLNGLSKSFDRILWHSAKVCWKPAVGTTTNGTIAFGVDWNVSTTTPTKTQVMSLTPVVSVPVWQSTDRSPLVLPGHKLMTRREYTIGEVASFDTSPASILVYLTGSEEKVTSYGDLWLEYDVTLSGTKS